MTAVESPIHSARMVHFEPDDVDPSRSHASTDDGPVSLAEHDIIVNCVLQDPDAPLILLTEDDLPALAPGSLIIDVSCDDGMGFSWARPTSFARPTFMVGSHVHYYAVDHSPSHLWDSASWEISEALLQHLPTVLSGPGAWEGSETIRRAIEIRDGVIQNPGILSFQRRAPEYPHPRR